MDRHRWRLDGQLALVTGASAGIGLAIARELLGFGADVLIVARDADALEMARDELAEEFPDRDIHALAADVADDEQRREILDWVEDQGDGLNILVNNAGGNLSKPATDYTEDEWRGIFEINLFSAFELSRYAHPLLTRHAASSIVNVGSVSGITHVRTGAPYGMSQGRDAPDDPNLAVEWAEDGVRVNAVAPWYIRTRRTSGQAGRPGLPRGGARSHADAAASASRRKSPRRWRSCACRRRVTSPANASRWMAGSCATGSERLVPTGSGIGVTRSSEGVTCRRCCPAASAPRA